jgi:hypothetical protein
MLLRKEKAYFLEDLANPEVVVVVRVVKHLLPRGDERCAADALLTPLREAPGTKCARGQSAESDLDKQSGTPTGQAVSRPGLARA